MASKITSLACVALASLFVLAFGPAIVYRGFEPFVCLLLLSIFLVLLAIWTEKAN